VNRVAAATALTGTQSQLATPPDLGWFPAAIAGQGRPDLDRALLRERRDCFLREALEHLTQQPPRPASRPANGVDPAGSLSAFGSHAGDPQNIRRYLKSVSGVHDVA